MIDYSPAQDNAQKNGKHIGKASRNHAAPKSGKGENAWKNTNSAALDSVFNS